MNAGVSCELIRAAEFLRAAREGAGMWFLPSMGADVPCLVL